MSTTELGDMLVRYKADISDLTKNVKQAKSDISSVGQTAKEAQEKTSGGFAGMLKSAVSFASGMAVFSLASDAIGAVKSQLTDLFQLTMQHQDTMTQTNQVLKSTHDVSGMTANALDDLSTQFSKTTRFSADTVEGGENLLLTFTNIGKNVFPQATQAILDVSTAMHQDLQSSAIQVGKALGDPLTGMTALQRIGVTFSASEKEQIKTMMAHNDIMGAQKVILKELSTEFGGSAQAAGQTFAGKLDILKNRFDDLKIKIGTALLPILNQFLGWFLKDGMPVVERFAAWFSKDGVAGIQRFAGWIQNNLIPALQSIGKWIGDNIIPALLNFGAWFQHDGIPALQNFWQIIRTQVIPAIQAFFAPLVTLVGWVHDHWSQIWSILGPIVVGAFNVVIGSIKIAWALISGIFKVFSDIVSGNWKQLWTDLKDMFSGIWDGIMQAFKGGVNELIGLLNGLITGLDNIGIDVGPIHIHPHIPTIPMLATGGFIQSSGLAFVHAGETVVPRAQTTSLGSSVVGGGQTFILEVDSIQLAQIVNKSSDRLVRLKLGAGGRAA